MDSDLIDDLDDLGSDSDGEGYDDTPAIAGSSSSGVGQKEGSDEEELTFAMAHITPPQSAPDWIKASPLADPESPFG